jgi:glycosyltransferase involved in cell wall biosynthesis
MNIGFDAKRYFHNATGLGNYSRTLVNGLAQLYPQHQYFLFNPKPSQKFGMPQGLPVQEVLPQLFFDKQFSALWRSKRMVKSFAAHKLELYHGLSHEIPAGLKDSKVRSVVTIHDLIFERYPAQYGPFEVRMHRAKIKWACRHADRVIAISRQTASDLQTLYKVPPGKIDVCYQSCDPHFAQPQPETLKAEVQKAYHLPKQFLLYVGSLIERKNLLGICKGMHAAGSRLQLPLVVVGTGKKYREKVASFLAAHNMQHRVHFLADAQGVGPEADIRHPAHLAALYQMATALVYPSYFEGFGIPVLEALWSRVPVVTSNVSCLPETGGNGVLYVDPASTSEMAAALLRMQNDETLREELINKGWAHAQNFTPQKCTAAVMNVYQKTTQ